MQKPISKKLISLSLIIVIFSGLFLVNVGWAEAAPGVLEDAAKWLIGGLFTVLLYIAQAFTAFVGNIFKGIVDFGFQQMDVVRMGWTITRDIVNMFFILGLIVIAFATILRIETYGIKALLPKLIIIALLINFSYLVCGLIIDATQIAATYFVNQIETEDIAIAVLSRLKVIDAIRGVEGMRVAITDYDPDMVVILTTAFSTIIIFLAGFVMLVGAILLFIRVGALWALIILAPFAWFFSIFPGKLKSYSSQWWNSFLQYAFFAPIYIFFIFLVLKISKAGVLEGMGLTTGETAVGLGNLTLVPMFGDLNMLFRYVFLIILLFGAPTIAMSMGIKGAGAAQSFVKGTFRRTGRIARKMTLKPAWYGIKAGARKFERGVLAPKGISPRAFIKGWKERRERVEEEKMAPAIGDWRDKLNRFFGEGKTFHKERAKDLLRQKEQMTIRKQDLSLEGIADIVNETGKAVKKGKTHLIPKWEGAVMELADRADEEGVMGNLELGEKYKWITSSENYQELIKDVVPDKEEGVRFAGQLGALAKQRGIHYLSDLSSYDYKLKKHVWTPTEEERERDKTKAHLPALGERAATELSKLSPRYIYQYSNRRNFMTMNARTGESQDPTRMLGFYLRRLKFDKAHINDLQRYLPPESAVYIGKRLDKLEGLVNKIKAKNPSVQIWFDAIKSKVTGGGTGETKPESQEKIEQKMQEKGVA